ncbi:MAG TPA: prepilin-type N-terminal cleavage/methylation domain-containing protein [Mycobacteriales bacterium]|nr:prepilin-type N-terminal cleavage/methylation domain-containing protein [Mycobacteriales bacterium]
MTRFSLRAFKRRMNGDGGFSMVEVIISLLIIGVVSTASAGFFVSNIKDVNGQKQHQEAVYLADQEIETIQSLPVSKLVSGRTHAAVTALFATPAATALNIAGQDDVSNSANYDSSGVTTPAIPTIPSPVPVINGVSYNMDNFIDVCWFAVATGNCGPTSTASTVQEYRASVYVSWTAGGPCSSGCNYSTSTLIDPTVDPTFNSNLTQPALLTGPTPATVDNDSAYSSPNACTTATGTDDGTEVVITATNLKTGVRVWISSGGGTISEISQPNASEIDFCLQAGDLPGSYTLSIINTDGGHFQTSITEVPNISSATGWTYGGTLTLNGGGFEPGATVSASGGVGFGSPTITDGTGGLDKITLPAFNGPTNGASSTITVTNPDGTSATYKVTAPTETAYSTSPQLKANGAWVNGQTTSLTVTGSGFQPGSATNVLTNGNGTVTETYLSPTSERLVITGATPGTETVLFYNADGGSSSTFNIPIDAAPGVTSTSPTFLKSSTLTTVTVSGTGFQSNMTASQSDAGSISVSGSVAGANSTGAASTITLHVTDTTTTSDTITLTNPTDGGTTTFTLDAGPVVSGESVTTIGAAVPTSVTVSGTGFQSNMTASDTSAGTLTVTGITGANSTGSASTITLNVTANTTKSDTITLTNPSDGGTVSFTLNVIPVISNLAGTLTHSSSSSFTITGSGFVTAGTTTVTLTENGTTLTTSSVTVGSTTSITFKATPSSTRGSRSFVVKVTNPDGSVSATFTKSLTVS